MTFEKKCFVSPADVIAVHYECGNCHAAVVIPIEKLKGDRWVTLAVADCQQCGKPSGLTMNTKEGKVFFQFNEALGELAEVLAARNLVFRLEIKCPQ